MDFSEGRGSIPLEAQGGTGKSLADKHLDPAIVIQKGAVGREKWGGTRDGPGPGAERGRVWPRRGWDCYGGAANHCEPSGV